MEKTQLSKADIKRACDILRMDDGVGASNYIEQLSWLLFLKVFENIEEELRDLAEGKYEDIIEPEYKWSTWAKKDWKDKDELVYFINQKLFPYLRNLKGTPEKEKVSEIFREITNRIHSSHTLLDTIDILDQIKMAHFQDTHLLSQVYEEILQEMGSEGGWSGEFYTPRPIIRLMIKIIKPKLGEVVLDPFVGSGGFLVESFDYIQQTNPKMGVKEWETLQRKTFYGQEKKPLPYLIGMMNLILHRILVPNLIRTNTLMEDIHNMPESQKVDVILTNPPFGGKENKSVQENYPIQMASTEGLALQYVMRRLKNGGRCGIILPEGQILFGGGAFQAIREELLQKFNVTAIISLPQGAFAQMGAGVKTNLIFFEKTGPTKNIWFGEVKGKFTKKKTIQDIHFEEVYTKIQEHEISENSWALSLEQIAEKKYSLLPRNPNNTDDSILPEPKELAQSIHKTQSNINNMLDEMVTFAESVKLEIEEIKNQSLIEIADFFNDGDWIEKKDQSINGIRLVQTGNVGIIEFKDKDDKKYVTEETFKRLNCKEVYAGDILISRLPDPVGRACIVPKLDYRLITAVDCTIFRPKKEYSSKYLNFLINSPDAILQVSEYLTGSSRKRISRTNLEKVKLPIPFKNGLPDKQTQDKIAEKLEKIQQKKREIERKFNLQITDLNKLGKSFLHLAFQGKL